MPGAPFDYLHHLVTVPVTATGRHARFILDSGIGLALVTDRFAERLGIEPGPETFIGRRMSGYDGLVGDAFLRQFAVTFDIPARQLVLS